MFFGFFRCIFFFKSRLLFGNQHNSTTKHFLVFFFSFNIRISTANIRKFAFFFLYTIALISVSKAVLLFLLLFLIRFASGFFFFNETNPHTQHINNESRECGILKGTQAIECWLCWPLIGNMKLAICWRKSAIEGERQCHLKCKDDAMRRWTPGMTEMTK